MYSIVLRAHLNTGHGGRDNMLKEVNKKYANVTRICTEFIQKNVRGMSTEKDKKCK